MSQQVPAWAEESTASASEPPVRSPPQSPPMQPDASYLADLPDPLLQRDEGPSPSTQPLRDQSMSASSAAGKTNTGPSSSGGNSPDVERRLQEMEARLSRFEGTLGRIESILLRVEERAAVADSILLPTQQQHGSSHLPSRRQSATNTNTPSNHPDTPPLAPRQVGHARRDSEDSQTGLQPAGSHMFHAMPSMSFGGRRRMPKGGYPTPRAGAGGGGAHHDDGGRGNQPGGARVFPGPPGGAALGGGRVHRSFVHNKRTPRSPAARNTQPHHVAMEDATAATATGAPVGASAHPSFSSYAGSTPTPTAKKVAGSADGHTPTAVPLVGVPSAPSMSFNPPSDFESGGAGENVPCALAESGIGQAESYSPTAGGVDAVLTPRGKRRSTHSRPESDGAEANPVNPLAPPPLDLAASMNSTMAPQDPRADVVGRTQEAEPDTAGSPGTGSKSVGFRDEALADGEDGDHAGADKAPDALGDVDDGPFGAPAASALAGSKSRRRRDRRVSMKLVSDDDSDSDGPNGSRSRGPTRVQSTVGVGRTISTMSTVDKRRRRSLALTLDPSMDAGDQNAIAKCLSENQPVDSDRMFVYVSDSWYVAISLALICLASLGIISGTGFDIHQEPPWVVILFVVIAQMYSLAWMALRGGFVRKMIGDSEIADTHRSIARHYARTWFLPDLLTSFPFEILFLGWWNHGFYYSMTRHFLRAFRVTSLARSSNPLLPERPVLVFIMLTGLWFFLIVALAVGYQVLEGSQESLTTAIYWATATVTSTGYGDIATASTGGRIFAVIGMICSIFLVSLLQAYSTSLLTSRDVVKEDIARKKSTMHSMLDHYGIPWDLQKDVIYTFPAVLDSQREHAFKEMIEGLPPRVTERLEVFIKIRVLQSTPCVESLCAGLPSHVSDMIYTDLAEVMSLRKVPAMEYFVQPGQPCNELLIVQSGVAEVFMVQEEGEVVVQTLRRGMTFGTSWLADPSAPSKYWTVGAQALQLTETYALHQNDFEALLQKHSEVKLNLPTNASALSGDGDHDDIDEAAWTADDFDDGASEHPPGTDDPFGGLDAFRNALAARSGALNPRRKSMGAATIQSMMSRSNVSDGGDALDGTSTMDPGESLEQS